MNGLALALFIPAALTAVNDRGFWAYWLWRPAAPSDIPILSWLAVFLALLVCRGLGRRTDEETAVGLGFGAWATAIFLAGLAGFYNRTTFVIIALACAYFGRDGVQGMNVPRWQRLSLFEGLCAGLVAAAAFHALVAASAAATDWDSLAYHLALPKLYLGEGRVTEVPWMVHSRWPHLPQVFSGQWLALGAEAAPWQSALGAAVVWAVFRSAKRELGRHEAWLSAALLAVQPAFLAAVSAPRADAAFALLHFSSALALWQNHLAAAGLLAGFCAASKLHGFLFIAFWTAWLLLRHRRKDAVLFLGAALVPSSPWLLKTWIETGNPVWPFLFGGSDGADIVAAASKRLDYWRLEQWRLVLGRYGLAFIAVPFLGLAALAAAMGKTPPPFLRFLLIPALPYALAVLPRVEFARFLLPLFPALALFCAWATAALWRSRLRWGAAALAALALWPALGLSANNQLFALLSRERYLERALDHYRFYKEASALLEPGSRVLLFREIRGYYLDARYMWGDPANQGVIDYARLADPSALARRLGELGVTHILVNENPGLYSRESGYYPRRTLALMDGVLAASRTVLEKDGLSLRALDARRQRGLRPQDFEPGSNLVK